MFGSEFNRISGFFVNSRGFGNGMTDRNSRSRFGGCCLKTLFDVLDKVLCLFGDACHFSLWCQGEDSNLHELYSSHGSKPCASTNSATLATGKLYHVERDEASLQIKGELRFRVNFGHNSSHLSSPERRRRCINSTNFLNRVSPTINILFFKRFIYHPD